MPGQLLFSSAAIPQRRKILSNKPTCRRSSFSRSSCSCLSSSAARASAAARCAAASSAAACAATRVQARRWAVERACSFQQQAMVGPCKQWTDAVAQQGNKAQAWRGVQGWHNGQRTPTTQQSSSRNGRRAPHLPRITQPPAQDNPTPSKENQPAAAPPACAPIQAPGWRSGAGRQPPPFAPWPRPLGAAQKLVGRGVGLC